jgi:hypothetical protein
MADFDKAEKDEGVDAEGADDNAPAPVSFIK